MSSKKQKLKKSLSDKELSKYYPVYIYDELKDFTSSLSSLPNKFIVLYKTSTNRGHWCCLFKNKDGINFYDSYGYRPDGQFEYAIKKINFQKNHLPYISNILIGSGLPIHYNDYKFQSDMADINTCGRWCLVRLYFSHLNATQFKKLIDRLADVSGLNYDDLIVVTQEILF